MSTVDVSPVAELSFYLSLLLVSFYYFCIYLFRQRLNSSEMYRNPRLKININISASLIFFRVKFNSLYLHITFKFYLIPANGICNAQLNSCLRSVSHSNVTIYLCVKSIGLPSEK